MIMSHEELVPDTVSYEKLLFIMNGRSVRRPTQAEQLYVLELTHELFTLDKRVKGKHTYEEEETQEDR
jgi:hypothetical protein